MHRTLNRSLNQAVLREVGATVRKERSKPVSSMATSDNGCCNDGQVSSDSRERMLVLIGQLATSC
jgi:hypothetical protein